MALSYIAGSALQGGADAFTTGVIATALSGISNVAYRVRELLFEIPRLNMLSATIVNFDLALCRRLPAAMPLITDSDVMAKVRIGNEMLTSGAISTQNVIRLHFSEDDELLIVEDPVYLAFDSTGSGLTQTAYCRVGYERVSISALDRLTLLTASLN